MSAGHAAPAGNDHMPSLEGAGDKGAGQANFDIKDLGMLGATLAKFMGPAEASAAQHFGAKDLMLPYANSENQQV